MTAIWASETEDDWRLLSPAGFPDEATLHSLVEQAPQLLPLAGSPRLAVVGREVRVGSGSADLIAVEPNGRLVIIEVKLAYNAEARRAVVAQVLTYAAALHGLDPTGVEDDVLGPHLRRRGLDSLAAAAAGADQTAFDLAAFNRGLADSLEHGRFRLVIVLDAAPDELVRLVGYLETVTADELLIDLVTVDAYDIGGTKVVVPRRVEPERRPRPTHPAGPRSGGAAAQGQLVAGAADFVAAIDTAPADQQPLLRRLAEWAVGLERQGHATLSTYHGKGEITTLLPRLPVDNVGLVTIYRDAKTGYLQLWRSVIERRAPHSLPRLETLLGGLRQGMTTRDVSDELLAALSAAYAEAAGGHLDT